MVVKVYISGISGNKEVKKRQQRVLMILDSKSIKYDVIDITEPGREADKDFMQNNAKSNGGTVSDPNPRSPLPPQVFNDDEYCGDYDQFDLANEVDTLEQFLKVEVPPEEPTQDEKKENTLNGDAGGRKEKSGSASKEASQERETVSKEGTPAKDSTPQREVTPAKDSAESKEPSPAKDAGAEHSDKEGTPAKEASPEKEQSPERQKSIEKDTSAPVESEKDSDIESKKASKENSPEVEGSVNENGKASSREQSQEKESAGDSAVTDQKKENPSEALIQSEAAAAED